MKRFARVIIGVGIIGGAIALTALLWITRPEAAKKDEVVTLPVVEYLTVELGEKTFDLPSQGIIEADRRTQLSAEVMGKVIEVAAGFEVGARFEKDALLVKIDPTDYEAAVAQAASVLADAEAGLASEEAKAEQAMRDWQKMGNRGAPSDLLARKPQLASALAKVESARASLAKAKTDRERTTIRAPYDCVISSTQTEIGSYLNPSAPVAEVYETSPFEVRLPLSVDDTAFLPVDEAGNPKGEAEIRASAGGKVRRWKAEIVRSEGEIDRATRSLYLVARIGDALDPDGIQIRPGLYVDASIPSRPLPRVAAIPFRAFRNLDEVVILDGQDRIEFRKVNVLHREGNLVYVNEGLEDGDRVSVTELPDFIVGMKVEARPAPAEIISPANPVSE